MNNYVLNRNVSPMHDEESVVGAIVPRSQSLMVSESELGNDLEYLKFVVNSVPTEMIASVVLAMEKTKQERERSIQERERSIQEREKIKLEVLKFEHVINTVPREFIATVIQEMERTKQDQLKHDERMEGLRLEERRLKQVEDSRISVEPQSSASATGEAGDPTGDCVLVCLFNYYIISFFDHRQSAEPSSSFPTTSFPYLGFLCFICTTILFLGGWVRATCNILPRSPDGDRKYFYVFMVIFCSWRELFKVMGILFLYR